MSYTLPDDSNPFQAPRAGIGGRALDLGGDEEAELVRRTYLNHEASVKSLGLLYYFGAIILGLIALGLIVAAAGAFDLGNPPPNFTPQAFRVFLAAIGIGLLVLATLSGAIGYGLAHLQVWARWVVIVFQVFGFVMSALQIALIGATGGAEAMGRATGGALISNLIPAYIFYLVASAKGAMVFSAPYKDVIRKTPHIKYKTSIIVKILLVILVLVLGLAVIGGIMAAFNR